jgi:hypothetical protein
MLNETCDIRISINLYMYITSVLRSDKMYGKSFEEELVSITYIEHIIIEFAALKAHGIKFLKKYIHCKLKYTCFFSLIV